MSTDYNMEDSQDPNSAAHDQTDGGAGESGGEENSEADMIFAPEASKPGRNAGMLMVAFVMIGVGVIYFMRARTGGPNKASAEVAKAETSINGFINDRDQIKKMKDMINNTQKVVDQFTSEKKTVDPELKDKEFNPFLFVSPNGGKPEIKKPTDDPNAKAKEEFLRKVGELRVQYIMVSSTMKSAMVNNRLIKEGQELDGLVFEKITPQAVIVSSGKFRAEVKQNK